MGDAFSVPFILSWKDLLEKKKSLETNQSPTENFESGFVIENIVINH